MSFALGLVLAAAAGLADLDAIDRQVAAFTGAAVGQPGGAAAPVDRRLRLQTCTAPLAVNWNGLRRDSEASAQEGFTGRLAIHPAQVPVINAAYRPSDAALARAQRIVAAFAAQPGVGAIGLDGAMVDRPHLVLAERLIARAAALGIASS